MASYRVAVGGEDLTVYEFSNDKFTAKHDYVPVNRGSILDSSWAPDGACVASVAKNSQKIIMTYSKR